MKAVKYKQIVLNASIGSFHSIDDVQQHRDKKKMFLAREFLSFGSGLFVVENSLESIGYDVVVNGKIAQ